MRNELMRRIKNSKKTCIFYAKKIKIYLIPIYFIPYSYIDLIWNEN